MAAVVFYKFKSSKDFVTLPIDGPFVSVSDLKTLIFTSKRYGHGRDFDLLVSDAQSLKEYVDDSFLIRQNSSLLIRRIPGLPVLPIVIGGDDKPEPEIDSSMVKEQVEEEDFDSHDFGEDFNSIPKTLPSLIQNPSNTHSKEVKVERGFRVSYPASAVKRSVPPQGYVCRRCKVAGHFIQHCPTNGDPNYDIVHRVNPTTTTTTANSKGCSTSTSSSASASANTSSCVTNCNSVGDDSNDNAMFLPELCCQLCKNLMRDAALTKCCFNSFCLNCIRDHIVSNSACVCQKRIILADDNIVPNMAVRDTINRILNQGGDRSSSSDDNGRTSSSVVQDFASSSSIAASKPDQETEIIVPQVVHNSEQVKMVPTPKEQENKKKRKANISQVGVDSYLVSPAHCFPYGYAGYLPHNHIHAFSSGERDLSQFGQPMKKFKV